MIGLKKTINTYGKVSLLLLIISIILMLLLLIYFPSIELDRGILFYGSLLLYLLSFIIGIIGLIKDKKKIISIISIFLIILIFIFVLYFVSYFFNVILPRTVESFIDSWKSWEFG